MPPRPIAAGLPTHRQYALFSKRKTDEASSSESGTEQAKGQRDEQPAANGDEASSSTPSIDPKVVEELKEKLAKLEAINADLVSLPDFFPCHHCMRGNAAVGQI